MLVTASQQKGYLEESEQELISRVFGFADIKADEVMVPRTEMVALPATATLAEVTETVAESGHARYPVYGEDLDDILGCFTSRISTGSRFAGGKGRSICGGWCGRRSSSIRRRRSTSCWR